MSLLSHRGPHKWVGQELPGAQVRAATNVPNRLEMSECRDRQVGTEVRALGSPSVQWTVRHCRWLPGWVAEALLVGRSWAVEKKRHKLVTSGDLVGVTAEG